MFKFLANIFKMKKVEKPIKTIYDGDVEIRINRKEGTFEIASPRTLRNDEIVDYMRKYL